MKEGRLERTILEEAPRGDHQSNGEAEVTVKEAAGLIRSLRDALHRRTGKWLRVKLPAYAWMCDYSGFSMTRFHVGEDGRTAYERMKGKTFREEMVEFGERVMYEVGAVEGQGRRGLIERWGRPR